MSAHTPGPWFVGKAYDDERIGPGVVTLVDDGGCGDPDCCGSRTYRIEIGDADAKLIAAAPALADAVELFVWEQHIKHCSDAGHDRLCVRGTAALRLAGRLP